MTRSGQMLYVYNHAEQMQGHPHEAADPAVLDYVGHEFHRTARNYPLRGSAPSPPPPYEPISYPLPSPLPTPTFPAPQPTTATIADAQHLRPVPPHLLNDRAFSPDPRDNPHFIMTSDERFLAASPPPPRDPASMRQIPPSLQPGRPMVSQSSSPHRRSHSSPHTPPNTNPVVPPKEHHPALYSQSGSPVSMSRRMISASSMFPQNPVWRPPVAYASSTDSGSSTSSHSSSVQHTPGASPPSSTGSSPRNSSAPTTPCASIHSSLSGETAAPPVPPLPEAPVAVPPPPARVAAPPRTSSYGLPRPRTPAQPPPIPGASASTHPATARPTQPIHTHSAPELHARPPPPPTLVRSVTAPPRPALSPLVDPAPGPQRSQTQRGEQQQHRGRSREQQSGQALKRQRSRRPSITAPRDLDRIDELDETDPRGLAWHHESPYELVTRTLSQKRKDGDNPDGGNGLSRNERQRAHKKPSMTFSVEPGQIFPSAALYQAMQPPYRPQPPTAAHNPPPFDPYGQDQLAYLPGAPSLPPTNRPSADSAKRRKSPSRSQPATQPTSQGSYQHFGRSRSPHGPPPQPPPPVGALPALPTEAAEPPFQPDIPVRPPLQERPSQRSHVRFESPSRPDVRPPFKQGSVDEAYDGIEEPVGPLPPVVESVPPPAQPPLPLVAQNALPPRRPPPPQDAMPPPPPQKPQPRLGQPQSRPSSMYLATSQSQSGGPRPDIALPPRRPAPSVQTQASLPPRHVPKQLVMPAPLQPLEEQRKAEAARIAQQHREQAIPQGRRSEEAPVRHQDVYTHGGRHMLHHSVSHRLPPVTQPPERQDLARSASQGQNRTQVIPMSGGPNVLRKRSVMNASTPMVGPEAAPSSHTAAMFAARVFDDKRKGKTVERVSSGVWSRDPVKEAEIQRELAGEYKEPKMGRKLSKLTRKLR